MILDKVNYPKDLKCLNKDELNELASEIREAIITKVNTVGGHFGPNLGIVETTIAMHYVFDAPEDKFVFDVSHQCYPHKMLTGRKEGFLNPEKYTYYTGYTAPEENEYDLFKVGHTSTSVSLATGLAKARDLRGGKENIVALIGDGSLTGGEALEGLNNASMLDSNIIIVVNDNDMSIAENYGGLYKNLKELRDTDGTCENNFFKTMGFDYKYVSDGHDINTLISTFKSVKDTTKPVIVHIHTIKGKGCSLAEENKENFHWIMPGTLDSFGTPAPEVESYNSIGNDIILEKANSDKSVIVINPATPGVHGFDKSFRDKLGAQYTDTGIAEEHAVAYSSALAKGGAKPILAIMSSFVQRTYDQISQDLCLNNSPVTMLVYWGALSGADATHLGCFDMSMLGNIPNLVYLAPTCKEEYQKMLDWSIEQKDYPVAIRVPFGDVVSTGVADTTDYSQLNKFKMVEKGSKVAIVGLGNFFGLAKSVKKALATKGIDATLINPVYITGVDKEILTSLKDNHNLVITLEDGILDGGFGEKIARFYGGSSMKVLNFGGEKYFTDRVPLEELYERYHLTTDLIVKDIMNVL